MFRLPRFLSLIPSSKLQAPTIKTSDEGRGKAFMFRLPRPWSLDKLPKFILKVLWLSP